MWRDSNIAELQPVRFPDAQNTVQWLVTDFRTIRPKPLIPGGIQEIVQNALFIVH